MQGRRQVIFGASALAGLAAINASAQKSHDSVPEALQRLEDALKREIPGLRDVRILYEPSSSTVPLIVTAFMI